MAHYSVEPRDTIFAKGYGLLSFVKNMGENIGTILAVNNRRNRWI